MPLEDIGTVSNNFYHWYLSCFSNSSALTNPIISFHKRSKSEYQQFGAPFSSLPCSKNIHKLQDIAHLRRNVPNLFSHSFFNDLIFIYWSIFQLKRFKKLYESYVPMRYKDYLKKMKRSYTWLLRISFLCKCQLSALPYWKFWFSLGWGSGEIMSHYKQRQIE